VFGKRNRPETIPQGPAEGIYARVAAASFSLAERKTREAGGNILPRKQKITAMPMA
jgi:hypothetical protein